MPDIQSAAIVVNICLKLLSWT